MLDGTFYTMTNFSPDNLVAFDLETHLLGPGKLAPPIVCGSFAEAYALSGDAGLLAPDACVPYFRRSIAAGRVICGANIAYDLGCLAARDATILPEIFAALDAGQIYDIQIAQSLDAIAGGHLTLDPRVRGRGENKYADLRDPSTGRPSKRYSLAACVDLVLGRVDAKANDAWRLSYALLEGIPFERWPAEARQYPVDDAKNTLFVAQGQLKGWDRGLDPYRGPARNLQDLPAQVRAAFALQLGACWGLRVDPSRLDDLSSRIEALAAEVTRRFQEKGWIRPDGSENQGAIKTAVAKAYGATGPCRRCGGECVVKIDGKRTTTCKGSEGGCDATGLHLESVAILPRSEKGGIKTDRDALMESGDPDLYDYAENTYAKIRETYIPYLRKGVSRPLSFSPNVLVASGRCSYESSPVHQFPRKGGVRETISARPGYVFCSTDYAAGELCTLAQITRWLVEQGPHNMAKVINETRDPGSLHTYLAATMIGADFDEMRKLVKAKDKRATDFRQAAKAGNFGLPGGMGSPTFVLAKRKAAEGSTTAPDGTTYPGIRFCVLIGGAPSCGKTHITKWGQNEIAPVCAACVDTVEKVLKPAFFGAYPEVRAYLDMVGNRVRGGKSKPVQQLVWSKEKGKTVCVRERGGCGYSDGANTTFQGLLADIGKTAFYRMTREAYTGRLWDDSGPSPLAGGRFPIFLHDEPLAELPEETAHLSGPRIAEIMMETGREFAPDVYWFAEPALSRFLSKDAAPVYKDGKLVVWGD